MTEDKIELTRRKVLASAGAIGVAGAGAGLGTSAFFSDVETFEGNTIAAGNLDLAVDWEEHYSYPQLFGSDDPTAGLDVTRSEPTDGDGYVGLPDPENPVVYVHEDDLDAFMSNTAVEAFPDPDNDGEQETELGDFVYDPCEDGANLPEDLRSNLHSGSGANEGAVRTNNDDTTDGTALIHLEDLKPGDFGEFTFSFHLCNNPGYVWLTADNVKESGGVTTEPEAAELEDGEEDTGELAENIQTIWWYDARGDNVPPRTDCSEQLYLTDTGGNDATELYKVELTGGTASLTKLLPNGQSNSSDISNGHFNQTDAIAATPNGDTVYFYDKVSERLGKYSVDSGAFADLGPVSDSPGNGVVLAGYSPAGTLWAADQNTDSLYTVDTSVPEATLQGDTGIDLSGADLAFASDGTLYVWSSTSSSNGLYEVVDPHSDTTAVPVDSSNIGTLDTDVTGMAIREGGTGPMVVSDNVDDDVKVIDRTDGSIVDSYSMTHNGSEFDHVFGDMTAGQLCGEVFHRGTLKDDLEALETPIPLDGNRSTPFPEFDGANDSSDRECFPAGVSHFIGFGWWLPESVGNEVQGDSISFDLGFYTQQCRNSEGANIDL